ncbi:MAG: citrulline utilization hydrolase CtlX [Niabella sp.]
MIRPANFGFNAQTAVNNAFQQNNTDTRTGKQALEEFDSFAGVLVANGLQVTVVQDTPEPHTPDAFFPNNWISFHTDGTAILYPMFAPNRRAERDKHIINKIMSGFSIKNIIDLSFYEKHNQFLEGTGSMVLDRDNKFAYACISNRTHPEPLYDFCTQKKYTPILFHAKDNTGQDIYHTNVMMCIAKEYVVICMDSIPQENDRELLLHSFAETGKEIIPISIKQMEQFAGNMLQVVNNSGEPLLIMSSQAYHALTKIQINKLTGFNRIIHAPLYTIEENGGGSARCMMAEIFLPVKNTAGI